MRSIIWRRSASAMCRQTRRMGGVNSFTISSRCRLSRVARTSWSCMHNLSAPSGMWCGAITSDARGKRLVTTVEAARRHFERAHRGLSETNHRGCREVQLQRMQRSTTAQTHHRGCREVQLPKQTTEDTEGTEDCNCQNKELPSSCVSSVSSAPSVVCSSSCSFELLSFRKCRAALTISHLSQLATAMRCSVRSSGRRGAGPRR